MNFFWKKKIDKVEKTADKQKHTLSPFKSNGNNVPVYKSYNTLMQRLEEDLKDQKTVIGQLETHLETMALLDRDLEERMHAFWKFYGPKIKQWLLTVQAGIQQSNAKVDDLKQKQASMGNHFKKKYDHLIGITEENISHWKHFGAAIITKVYALREVSGEIDQIQTAKKDSTTQLGKIIHNYNIYKEDVKSVLEEYRFREDFENRIQDELEKAISDISPEITKLVDDKIVENIKHLMPHTEMVAKEAENFDNFIQLVGSEIDDVSGAQSKILAAFQTFEKAGLGIKLKTNQIDIQQENLEEGITETMDLLVQLQRRKLSDTAALSGDVGMSELPPGKSFMHYQRILNEMGKTATAQTEVIHLLESKRDDFKAPELGQILTDFPDNYNMARLVSLHPWKDFQISQRLVCGKFGCDNSELFKDINDPNAFFCRVFQHFKGRSYDEITLNCIDTFLTRGKIYEATFSALWESDDRGLVALALKNPLLEESCFYRFQNATDDLYLAALAENPAVPTIVLNNIIANIVGKTTLQRLKGHPNATDFTQQLILKQIAK